MKLILDIPNNNGLCAGLWYLLNCFPYLKFNKIYPEIKFTCKAYSKPPNFNIIPDILEYNYIYQNDDDLNVSAIDLFNKYGHPKYTFNKDFRLAHDMFFTYLKIPDKIKIEVAQFFSSYSPNILAVHYRGTDKNKDIGETCEITIPVFCDIVNDFIQMNNIKTIFLCTDDLHFIDTNTINGNVIYFNHHRISGNIPLWRAAYNDSDNSIYGYEAIKDIWAMASCKYLLKNQSNFSAFAKVFNPDLKAYRITAFHGDWFPDCDIPLLQSNDKYIQYQLNELQKSERKFTRGISFSKFKINKNA